MVRFSVNGSFFSIRASQQRSGRAYHTELKLKISFKNSGGKLSLEIDPLSSQDNPGMFKKNRINLSGEENCQKSPKIAKRVIKSNIPLKFITYQYDDFKFTYIISKFQIFSLLNLENYFPNEIIDYRSVWHV